MINWTIYTYECIGALVVFTFLIMVPLCRNPLWWIHDYPKDIQEKYFETHERIPVEPLSATVLVKKGGALLFSLLVFVALMKLAGADSFLSGFLLSYGIWFLIDWYDCFFLDWVLFANLRRIRLPGTEEMDASYHQKKYHFVHSLIGMVLGLLPCLLCGLVVMLVS